MLIWLLRHGHAEPRSDAPDAGRELTQRGRDELRDNLARYRETFGPAPVIWSSERVRAWQTAEILAEAYEGLAVVPCPPLGNGDHDRLRQMLAAADPARDYVLVGHEPWLSEFYELETGQPIRLRKGKVAGFEFSSPLVESAEGPLFLDDLQARLISSFEAITLARGNYLDQSDDVETLHKYRVAIRRFRAFVSLLKPFVPGKCYREAQNKLREAARVTHRLRELDVTIIWLQGDDCTYSPDRARALCEAAERARAEERRIVESAISSQSCPESLLQGLGILLASLRYEELAGQSITDVVMPRLEQWSGRADRDLDKAAGDSLTELHPIRLKYKKVRYVVELYADSLDEASIELGKRARQLQTEIGERCDRLFMVPLLTELSGALELSGTSEQSPGL